MEILSIKVLRGPNIWSTYRKQLIEMKLDLQEAEALPTNKIDGFAERIEQLMPSLYEHRCSEKKPGGFFERIRRGTWLGHVIEHVALEMQSLAGMPCGFGRTRSTSKSGVYNVVFTYQLESAGIYAAKAAVRCIEALKNNKPYNLTADIQALAAINKNKGLGPSTQSILNAAKKRGIPYKRLDDHSLIMLGQGVHQKLLMATVACTTSNVGVELAADKAATKSLLAANHIPVPSGQIINGAHELDEAIEAVGFPLVIKPLNGNQGRGITTNINTKADAVTAFDKAVDISKDVIVESFIKGMDFRFLVINYKLEAVAKRTPAMVMGDGRNTIEQLIDIVNSDPNRGEGHEKSLTTIKIDAQTLEILARKNYTLDTILPDGEVLFLKDTANLSTGGTARDVTAAVIRKMYCLRKE